jgi:hypothetical protein
MEKEEYEEKLYNEILVDCKGEYEQNMSWFYYIQDEIKFPFIAYVEVKEIGQRENTRVLKKIKVIELSTDDSNFENNFDIKVSVEFDKYIMEFPLSKLEDIRASKSIIEIIELWKYWIRE